MDYILYFSKAFAGRGRRFHVLSPGAEYPSYATVIDASIVQGPPSYVVVASYLYPRHSSNALVKYADDTYLLVGSNK